MQSHSEPKPIYYYAVRSNSHGCAGWSNAQQWDVVLLIKCHTRRYDGLYAFPDDNRYWVSNITWEDFDMLTAFGVEWVKGFDHDIQALSAPDDTLL